MSAPDAEKLIRAHLAAALPGVTVSTSFPDTDRLHVQVEQEGGPVEWPIVERAQVRLVAWAPSGQRDAVKQLAADVMAAVADFQAPSVAGCGLLGGRSAVAVDPTTKRLSCWVLVRVNLLHA